MNAVRWDSLGWEGNEACSGRLPPGHYGAGGLLLVKLRYAHLECDALRAEALMTLRLDFLLMKAALIMSLVVRRFFVSTHTHTQKGVQDLALQNKESVADACHDSVAAWLKSWDQLKLCM